MYIDTEILEKENFKVCGLSTELKKSQKENYVVIREHWKYFNKELQQRKITGGRNWIKYGITIKKGDIYFYMTAIPFSTDINEFETIEIQAGSFAKFQHIGSMDLIKNTVYDIYKKHIPKSKLIIDKKRTIIHYEYYDYRFKWNKNNSVFDIFVPIIK